MFCIVAARGGTDTIQCTISYDIIMTRTLCHIQVAALNTTVKLMQLLWIYVNDSKVLRLSWDKRFETIFSISDYGYDASMYEFREVEVNAQANGDLNHSHEYLLTYFNSSQIGHRWNTFGVFYENLRQLDSYPIRIEVAASSFTMVVYASSGMGKGIIKFTLVRFRVTRK